MRWAAVALALVLVGVTLGATAALTLKVEQSCRTVHREGSQFTAPNDRTTCSWRVRHR
jgi:hypothetical protein